ncbi:hypothetical protein WA158_004832 [Blastocystis sp. Blastoise]
MSLGIIGSSSFLGSTIFKTFTKSIVDTQYGKIEFFCGSINHTNVCYVSRHDCEVGKGYVIPSEVNYKAIISGLKQLNCTHVLGTYSTGSLKKTIPVSSLVVPNDYALLQAPLYFNSGANCHISPCLSEEMIQKVISGLKSNGIEFIDKAIYFQTPGPRFETKAEICFYAYHFDLVGMTGSNEATLCQEAGMKFCMLCMVDNMCNGIGETLDYDTFKTLSAKNKDNFNTALIAVVRSICESMSSSKIAVDSIINAGFVIPVVPKEKVLENYSIVIKDGLIVDLLPIEESEKKYVAEHVYDRKTHAVLPGFVNSHTHMAMCLLRGYSDDKNLSDWLNKDIWPAEGKFISREFIQDGFEVAMAEMIRGGTTCFNDMYFHLPDAIDVFIPVGIRGVMGVPVFQFPCADGLGPDDYMKLGNDLVSKYGKASPLLSFSFAPHAPYTVGEDTYKRTKDECNKLGISLRTLFINLYTYIYI